jgi:hypothetical protein
MEGVNLNSLTYPWRGWGWKQERDDPKGEEADWVPGEDCKDPWAKPTGHIPSLSVSLISHGLFDL